VRIKGEGDLIRRECGYPPLFEMETVEIERGRQFVVQSPSFPLIMVSAESSIFQ